MDSSTVRLEDLWPCLQGMIPAALSTCAPDGTPNITFISQLYYVDPTHIAISHQFFNKTHKNVRENPLACAMMLDPRTLQAYRLGLRFDHSEATGPLFESMSLQLQAIASHAGMTDVFRLLASDVYEVLRIERVEGFTRLPTPPPTDLPSRLFVHEDVELLRLCIDRLSRADSLNDLLETALAVLDDLFHFRHAIILLADERNSKLFTIASRGYPENGVGSEVGFGDGLIGMVARARRALRLSAIDHSLRYARAARTRAEAVAGAEAVCGEIPLPGLPGAAAQIAVPLVTRRRLVGVVAVESADPLAFMAREDTLLTRGGGTARHRHRAVEPGGRRVGFSARRSGGGSARGQTTTNETVLLLPSGRLCVRRRRIPHSQRAGPHSLARADATPGRRPGRVHQSRTPNGLLAGTSGIQRQLGDQADLAAEATGAEMPGGETRPARTRPLRPGSGGRDRID